MYTGRNIYDQQRHLLFRKDQMGNGAQENQDLPSRNQNISAYAHKASPPAHSQDALNRPTTAETITTSHVFAFFAPQHEHRIQHAAQILISIIDSPRYELLRFLLDTLHARCEWVFTHSINVALMSLIIADRLSISKTQIETLAVGSLLHDAGKLRVPGAILEKDSSLTDDEMALMKKHCEYGIDIVAPYGLPQEILDIIIQHHERLDSSGYPHGLTSAQISELAKITMIADVIDAITSRRPYRPARSIDEAISIIKLEGDKFSAEYVSVTEMLLPGK